MAWRGAPLAALAIASIAGLTACGGEDLQEPRPNDPHSTVERAFTTTNPYDCETIATESFLARVFGTSDFADNVLECKRQVATALGYADAVAINGQAESGGRITFEITVSGGDVDAQTLDVVVVNRGGWWQIADIDGFEPTVASETQAGEQAEAELRDANQPPAVRQCMVERMTERLPLVSVQGLHGGLPPGAVSSDELAESCA